jgi:hypothetical protein
MMVADKAQQLVKQLQPSEGWWKNDTKEDLITVATFMLASGMVPSDVEWCIRKIITSMRAEYGE